MSPQVENSDESIDDGCNGGLSVSDIADEYLKEENKESKVAVNSLLTQSVLIPDSIEDPHQQ